MITALLVDDEPKALDRLAEMLEEFESVDVIGRARSVAEAEQFLRGRVPDVVFLDITMPDRLGVDLLASVPRGTKVVFVTAREGYAIDAFRAGAVDYVLKPFDHDRLAITVDRLKTLVEAEAADDDHGEPATVAPPQPDARVASGDAGQAVRIAVTRGAGVVMVPCADIVWIEAVQNYSRVQIVGHPPTVVRRTMAEWETLLPADAFSRISRSLIVQLPAIRATQWKSRDQMLVFFRGVKEALPIGRTPMARLKEALGQD